MLKKLLKLVLVSLLLSTSLFAASPWVLSPTSPVRTVNVATSAAFTSALSAALPGDEIVLADGAYAGLFRLTKNGTSSENIVIRSANLFGAKITGRVDMAGQYSYAIGLDVTDSNCTVTSLDAGLRVSSANVRLINNYVHDIGPCGNGITSFNYGPAVIYGNILVGSRHNIYMQNDYKAYGYKYVVRNMILDPRMEAGKDSQNIQIYGESGKISGFWLQENTVVNGRVLLGGSSGPVQENVVIGHMQYKATLQFGYKDPSQAEVKNNYIALAGTGSDWWWGVGEVTYTQERDNVFTDNELITPPGSAYKTFTIRTVANVKLSDGSVPEQCCIPKLRPTDSWDHNIYYGMMNFAVNANNQNTLATTLSAFQNATLAAGNAFGIHDQVLPMPTTAKIFHLMNEYDPTLSTLTIYNWGHEQDVATGLPPNTTIAAISTPLNTLPSSQSVHLAGAEFAVFLVRTVNPPPDPKPDYSLPTVLLRVQPCSFSAYPR